MAEIHQFPSEGQELPHSVEAEQQLLGAILTNSDILGACRSILTADDFHDPVHGRIYRHVLRLVDDGRIASPVTLRACMADDEGLREIGGPAYLARLAGAAITPRYAADYARLIVEQTEKRRLLVVVRDAADKLTDGATSPGDVAASLEAALGVLEPRTSDVRPVSMMAALTGALQQIERMRTGTDDRHVRPGIDRLAQMIPGFFAGELWLLAGRPSMGKTSVALNLALEAARAAHPVIFASLEMMPEAIAQRALSEQTAEMGQGINYKAMRSPDLPERAMHTLVDAARPLSELPLWFLPRQYATMDLLPVGVKQSLRLYKGDRMPLVVVDYAQLVKAPGREKFDQISAVAKGLKGMAMQLSVPVLALSQLNRQVEQRENKRPMLSDLRATGELEEDADGVIFCYRDEYYLERDEPDLSDPELHADWRAAMAKARNQLELIVSKNRMGEIGTAHVLCNVALNRIWN